VIIIKDLIKVGKNLFRYTHKFKLTKWINKFDIWITQKEKKN